MSDERRLAMAQERIPDEKKGKVTKPKTMEPPAKHHAEGTEAKTSGLAGLQRQVGNQAVQRLLAQRSGDGPVEVDDTIADRINRERGGGQALDDGVQQRLSASLGQDFSNVQVHTSSESHELNQELGAKAFTTGQDVFFREGAYEPHTGSGQELIAHELTHVVQQSSGRVSSSGGMTVNAPGDSFEQEADSVAKTVTNPAASAEVQRRAEEGQLQKQDVLEEEEEEPVEMEETPEEMPEEEEEEVTG
jgi:hypothetical protein